MLESLSLGECYLRDWVCRLMVRGLMKVVEILASLPGMEQQLLLDLLLVLQATF